MFDGSKLIFTGDLFRANPDYTFNQGPNVRLIKAMFGSSLRPLFSKIASTEKNLLTMEFDEFYRKIYGSEPAHVSDKWAALYRTDSLPPKAVEVLGETFSNAFVLSFEAAPSLKAFFDRIGVTYIDLRVHPFRFMNDNALSFSSNSTEILGRMKEYSMAESFVASEVNYVRSVYFSEPKEMPFGGLIYLLQTSLDSSIIHDGKFFSLFDARERLRELAGERPIFLRPHPFEKDGRLFREWIEIFPDTIITDINTYELFASENDCEYVTITSSAGAEAEQFGLPVTHLSPHHFGRDSQFQRDHAHILHRFWGPDFWRYVLCGEPVPDGDEHAPFVPDRLRKVFRISWGRDSNSL